MKYSFFSSKNATRCHQVSVAELLERISTNDLKDKCAAIQAHILAGEENEANLLKNELPCIVVAELYKETIMPPELRTAHQQNDKAVMQAYGFIPGKTSESDCVAKLFEMYQELTK